MLWQNLHSLGFLFHSNPIRPVDNLSVLVWLVHLAPTLVVYCVDNLLWCSKLYLYSSPVLTICIGVVSYTHIQSWWPALVRSAIPTFRVDDLHWCSQLYPPSELMTCIGTVSSKSLTSAPPELGCAALLAWVGSDEVSVTMLVLPSLISLFPCGCNSNHFLST